jgi:uncharacterized protein
VKRPLPTVVRVADVSAVPWKNGGGVTRELVAWPDPRDWLLRISVADIDASGPFSAFPGVDRWFAVLDGGALRLDTAGHPSVVLTMSNRELHRFPGDASTHCTMLGAKTRDFNLMTRRAGARVRQQSVHSCARLETEAECSGLFVAQAVGLQQDSVSAVNLPAMSCAWWLNPKRERFAMAVEPSRARGWWFEVETELSRAL